MSRIRWAFNTRLWQPTDAEWKKGMSLVSLGEAERIFKFVFLEDRKRTLVGHLALRAAISEALNVPRAAVELSRTDRGKPCVTSGFLSRYPESTEFSFNISHHGDYVVLSAERCGGIGIDVMKIEQPRSSRTVEEFFKTMQRQFTPNEWSFINSGKDQFSKLSNFYRLWALKESYLKATGEGISLNLQLLDFTILSPLTFGDVQTDTRVSLNRIQQNDWLFEERLIDHNHIVSVAIETPLTPHEPNSFESISLPRLIFNCVV